MRGGGRAEEEKRGEEREEKSLMRGARSRGDVKRERVGRKVLVDCEWVGDA